MRNVIGKMQYLTDKPLGPSIENLPDHTGVVSCVYIERVPY